MFQILLQPLKCPSLVDLVPDIITFQAVVSVACLLSFFYIVVISWAIWYLVASFSLTLAWSNCDNEFNTGSCFSPTKEWECLQVNNASFCDMEKSNHFEEICQKVPYSKLLINGSCYDTSTETFVIINRTTSAEEYWKNYVLGHVGYSWDNYVRSLI